MVRHQRQKQPGDQVLQLIMKELTFERLARINSIRCEMHYHRINAWTPTDWACALAGETGEACNFIKKLRLLDDYPENEPLTAVAKKAIELTRKEIINNIGKELADTVIYADLLAQRLNINLGQAVTDKFNEKSKQIGSAMML